MGNYFAQNCAIAFAALLIEAILGYPKALFALAGHPVTWTGALIAALDRRFNRDAGSFASRRAAGVAAMIVVVLIPAMAGDLLQNALLKTLPVVPAIFFLAILASACVAQRSLDEHVRAVEAGLRETLVAGRRAVSMIVGRETATLDEAGVARAAIESLAENFADGIVAPSFYLALAGLPGGLVYKAVNTADSMTGHKTPRHLAYGFAAAKLDDLLNWPAARLAALAIVAAAAFVPGASVQASWRIMRRDARGHASPNAGWPEAAMAGALGIKLGGPRFYAGRLVEDAGMGEGREAAAADVIQALRLYRVACILNGVMVLAALCLIARFRESG